MSGDRTSNRIESGEAEGPRIYVACLAAYNAGHLHGRWIEATQNSDAIQIEIDEMLAASPIPQAEEYAIHDHEGFECAKIAESSGIDRVSALASFIVEHGRLGAMVLEHYGGDLDEAKAAFENYAGQCRSLAEFAQDLTEETTEIPASLFNYIDYEAIARDMLLSGDVFVFELGFEVVHVFWSR